MTLWLGTRDLTPKNAPTVPVVPGWDAIDPMEFWVFPFYILIGPFKHHLEKTATHASGVLGCMSKIPFIPGQTERMVCTLFKYIIYSATEMYFDILNRVHFDFSYKYSFRQTKCQLQGQKGSFILYSLNHCNDKCPPYLSFYFTFLPSLFG